MAAADSKYYAPLIKAIQMMRKHFKTNKLIVFDLGMTLENRKNVGFILCIPIQTKVYFTKKPVAGLPQACRSLAKILQACEQLIRGSS